LIFYQFGDVVGWGQYSAVHNKLIMFGWLDSCGRLHCPTHTSRQLFMSWITRLYWILSAVHLF